jgi:phenylpropionate dioxygenase-like ring-hydroxylating dioxygenase large terminal subunit
LRWPATHMAAANDRAPTGRTGDMMTGSGTEAGLFLGLPDWVYRDPDFYRRELERVMLPSWQVVCHESDLSRPGDYQRLDFADRPIFVVRGEDRSIRAFYNVCRHRAARLLDGDEFGAGYCVRERIVCPYHGWTYDLEGRLRGIPAGATYAGLDRTEWGLKSPDVEIWQGFVFVRCRPGGPSVAETMAPYEETINAYRLPEMKALGRITLRPRDVNWKTVVENYSDGLHIPVAHPGLSALAGGSYRLEASEDVMHMSADVADRGVGSWSCRAYRRILPEVEHLPRPLRRRWNYFLLWPNLAFDLYPDQVDFMQMIPLGPERTLVREIPYGHADGRREMRLARYLNWRINRIVNAEDRGLIERVQAGMDSGEFGQGPLSSQETCLRALAERLRRVLPEALEPRPPARSVT